MTRTGLFRRRGLGGGFWTGEIAGFGDLVLDFLGKADQDGLNHNQ